MGNDLVAHWLDLAREHINEIPFLVQEEFCEVPSNGIFDALSFSFLGKVFEYGMNIISLY